MAIYEIKHELIGAQLPPEAGVAKDTSIVAMQPVFRDVSDGDIDGCASDGVKVIGIAAKAPTVTTAATNGLFIPVDAHTLILADWTKSTAYAETDKGLFYGMTITSGALSISLDDKDHDAVQLVRDLTECQNSTGTAGKAWFRFIPAVRQWDAIETA